MIGADFSLPSPRRLRDLQERLLGWYSDNRRDLPWRHTATRTPCSSARSCCSRRRCRAWCRASPTGCKRILGPREPRRGAARRSAAALAGSRLQHPRATTARLRPGGRRDCGGRSPAALPRTPGGLRALPGVGPYTARAVLVFAYNADLAAVDANVRRVLTHELRLAGDPGATDLQAVADAVLPRGRSRDWHNALMDYGALVLTARTVIVSLSRQGAFEGSRWQKRARLFGDRPARAQPLATLAAAVELPERGGRRAGAPRPRRAGHVVGRRLGGRLRRPPRDRGSQRPRSRPEHREQEHQLPAATTACFKSAGM